MVIRILSGVAWLALAATSAADEVPEKPAVGVSAIESNLRAAVAKVDITPPPGTKVVGHVREVEGRPRPTPRRVLLLDDGRTRAAIVTLDLIACLGRRWSRQVRDVVSKATGTPGGEHHGRGVAQPLRAGLGEGHAVGPGGRSRSSPRPHRRGGQGDAAGDASATARGRIDFNINRRKVIDGRAVVRLNPDGPCDHRVKVLRFDDGRGLDADGRADARRLPPVRLHLGRQVVAAAPGRLPEDERRLPGRGEAVRREGLRRDRPRRCSSRAAPATSARTCPGYPYRCGDEADIRWTGRDLGCAVVRAADRTADPRGAGQAARRSTRSGARRRSSTLPRQGGKTVRCELQALKVGPYLFLTMPGEPIVEYGFRLEKAIADRAVPIVVGYANGGIGYICTAKAYKEGGYEPNNSRSGPEAEEDLIAESLEAGRPRHRRRLRVVRPEAAGRPQELHPVDPDRDG